MSRASERKKMGAALAAYSLVGTRVVAAYLDVSEQTARELDLPWVRVGHQWKVDPLDLIVHVLAGREGVSAEDYWERHGEAVPEHARRYIARIRKLETEATAA